ncbi:MAG: hypothetical protein ACREXP_02380 [Steroidobacteraceae bacterium]
MSERSRVGTCAHGDSSLIRPHFTEGLLLQDDDLTAGVTYTRALSRLMFRTLFGCGVLCGLKVSPPRIECGVLKIDVAAGLGLSCLGDPVEVAKAQTVAVDSCKVEVGEELWIAMRGTEKCCAPRTAICADEDNPSTACTRERDGFEICAFPSRPQCSCGCAPLAPPPPPPPDNSGNTWTPAPAPSAGSSTTAPPPPSSTVPLTTTPPSASAPTSVAPPSTSWPTSVTPPAALPQEPAPGANTPCHCNKRTGENACYEKFYQGECPCTCCDCEWIILAVAKREGDTDNWNVDHSVRRFVRPVLMRDPLAPA